MKSFELDSSLSDGSVNRPKNGLLPPIVWRPANEFHEVDSVIGIKAMED